MSDHPHILVVGAGLIGLSSADELLRRGARVTVIEAQDAVMTGASFANSGMLHPSQACSWTGPANDPVVDAAVHRLAMTSMTVLRDRMTEFGLTESLARAPGCYQLFDHTQQVDQAFERLSARGIRVDRVAALCAPFGRAALYFPEDRSADAQDYGQALAISVVNRGGEIIVGQSVEEVIPDRNHGVVVRSGSKSWEVDAVILASGAQANRLLGPLGRTLPIEPVRGWAVDYAWPDKMTGKMTGKINVPDSPVMDAQSRSALTKFADRIRLSGTWGTNSHTPLLERWTNIAPDLMAELRDPLRIWSGLRPVSGKGRPFIGQTGVAKVWINAGHGHMGWTLCAGSAIAIADDVLEGRPTAEFSV